MDRFMYDFKIFRKAVYLSEAVMAVVSFKLFWAA